MTWRSAATLVAFMLTAFCGHRARAQYNPVPCPTEVDHRILGYPDGFIPYSDWSRSGEFWVSYLYDPVSVVYGMPSLGHADYHTEPDMPRDRYNPRLVWDLAEISCFCDGVTLPTGQTFVIVTERPFGKRGVVMLLGGSDISDHQPTENDTWREVIGGVGYVCSGQTDPDGTRVVTCVEE